MADVVADIAPAEVQIKVEEKPTLTPPASEGTDKPYDSGSELSDLEVETTEKTDNKVDDNDGEIQPDHYYEGGKIPVFKPVCALYNPHPSCVCLKIPRNCLWYDMQKLISRVSLDNGPVPQLQDIHIQD